MDMANTLSRTYKASHLAPVTTPGSSLALPGAEHSHWSNQSAQHSKRGGEQVVDHIAVNVQEWYMRSGKLAMALSYNSFAAIYSSSLASRLLDDMLYSICLSVCQPVCLSACTDS